MVRRQAMWMMVFSLVVGAALCQGAPLYLVPSNHDISSFSITIDYNATTDVFTASGTALQYDVPPAYGITDGTFDLTATIDESGVASSGSLTVTGTTSGGSGGSGTLLTADLVRFGFSPDGSSGTPTFEFVTSVTGGMLASDFGGTGSQVGTILTSFDSFSGSFDADYQSPTGCNPPMAMADTFNIPEPTSATLLLGGILFFASRRRRLLSLFRSRTA